MVVCATCCYIFFNPFTSCVTDHYLLQQYIIMHTIKRPLFCLRNERIAYLNLCFALFLISKKTPEQGPASDHILLTIECAVRKIHVVNEGQFGGMSMQIFLKHAKCLIKWTLLTFFLSHLSTCAGLVGKNPFSM